MAIIPSSNPGSKAISIAGTQTCGSLNQSIEKELSATVPSFGPGTYPISINCTSVRTLLGVPSGAISFSCAYGKSSVAPFNILILTVGGGGGGGAIGGGGAGGYKVTTATGITSCTPYTVTVGCGGLNASAIPGVGYSAGYNGGDTTVISPSGTITAYGGGGGGSSSNCSSVWKTVANGYPGPGSGIGYGGGGIAQSTNSSSVCQPGGSGAFYGGGGSITGPGANPNGGAVGGGGAGASGGGTPGILHTPTSFTPGKGACGIMFADGNYYSGGGGNGQFSVNGVCVALLAPSHGAGGLGGGGTGFSISPIGGPATGTSGTNGTGGGGGGGHIGTPNIGSGGSGVVKFIYAGPAQKGTGGTVTNLSTLPGSPSIPAPSLASSLGPGPYWIHTFPGPGTFLA